MTWNTLFVRQNTLCVSWKALYVDREHTFCVIERSSCKGNAPDVQRHALITTVDTLCRSGQVGGTVHTQLRVHHRAGQHGQCRGHGSPRVGPQVTLTPTTVSFCLSATISVPVCLSDCLPACLLDCLPDWLWDQTMVFPLHCPARHALLTGCGIRR